MYSPLEAQARTLIMEAYPNASIVKVDYQFNSIFSFHLSNGKEGFVNVRLNKIRLYLN